MPSAKIALISLLIIIALIIALYGQILIAQSSPVYPTGESWRTFGYLLSGLQIEFRNETNATSCTLGYFVRYQGRVALVTAGHCFYTL